MALKTLEDLMKHMLQDIYYAEKKLTKALPKMAKKATSTELKKAFESHLKETLTHVTRLEDVFGLLDQKPKSKKCPAIDGLIEEAQEVMQDAEDEDTLDAGLIAMAQGVEHYEIARYGTLVAFAKQLGYAKAAKILQSTLTEEHGADEKLTGIAEGNANMKAAA